LFLRYSIFLLKFPTAIEIGITPALIGVDLFERSSFNGIPGGVSMAGGAEIMIKGTKFSMTPSNVRPVFDNGVGKAQGPALSCKYPIA
jgi:hypothetical protein